MQFRELVESNTVNSACHLQKTYHSGKSITLMAGQKMLADNPTSGKLDTHWTSPQTVIQLDGTSIKIRMRAKEQVLHINCIHPLLQKDTSESETAGNWTPLSFQHVDSSDGQEDEIPHC